MRDNPVLDHKRGHSLFAHTLIRIKSLDESKAVLRVDVDSNGRIVARLKFLERGDFGTIVANDAVFTASYLAESSFRGTSLVGADLSRCNLNDCDFSLADLRNANLSRADVRGARFNGAALEGSDFENALADQSTQFDAGNEPDRMWKLAPNQMFEDLDLGGRFISQANLRCCTFRSCSLVGTTFNECDLSGSVFHSVDISNAHFVSSQLTGVRFHNMDMSECTFEECSGAPIAGHHEGAPE